MFRRAFACRRSLLAAGLAAAAAACAAAPASAVLPAPVWGAPEAIATAADTAGGQGITGGVTPIGGAWAVWSRQDGAYQRLSLVYRPPGGAWGSPVDMSPAGSNASVQNEFTATAADGTVTFVYYVQNVNRVYARDLSPAGTLGDPVEISAGDNGGGCGTPVTAADGTQYVAWCSDESHMRTRPPGGTWSDPETISEGGTDSPTLTPLPNGDLLLIYKVSSTSQVRASVRHDGVWSVPHALNGTPDSVTTYPRVALDGDGRAVVYWGEQTSGVPRGYTAILGADGWGAATQLGNPGVITGTVLPDGNGDIVAGWLEYGMSVDSYSAVLARGEAAFGGATSLSPPGELSGVSSLTARADGSLYGFMLHGTGLDHLAFGSISRPAAGGPWTPPADFTGATISASDGSFTAIDPEGSVLMGWKAADGTPTVAVGDAAGPRLSGLTVPATAQPGDEVAVSVTATDWWSDVERINWSFGDGASANGAAVAHAYTAGGTYTVTVTATDTVGHATTATRTITVAEPPADDTGDDTGKTPKPPVVIAPVIEARLAGKTVTVNARVTLKAGQKCKGTITVTTAFGGKTYKVPAKLAVKNGACRATAQITLKKTPSLRTKLRVTVGATKADKKKLTPRTITSRRG